ncbi:IS1182 family transposase [Mucilaginibacter sp.]|uniref:IS1182 family transposase n=1 Tax=Mucilaginibacter sp. TaxID=1882438 RepID=UPI003266F009
MQGKKHYQEKLFTNFQLSDRVPADNIYRRLKEVLDLQFLYSATSKYYGKDGQKSIDPVVFFKLLLVGYLENQPSDRRIINIASMRLDILFFIGYDIDEELPWHSTLSRTRQLYDEEIFTQLFKQVLKQCIDKGMLTGKRQAIDSVFVKANASLDSIKEKSIMQDAAFFADELKQAQSEEENGINEDADRTNGAKPKKRSNANRSSTTDPDSRMSVKPGKVMKLNYLSQISVDTSSYVITSIGAFHADKKDSQYLDDVLEKIETNLKDYGLAVEEVIADANYSSSSALESLISRGITGYIPNAGTYKQERKGFTYDAGNDRYVCGQGNTLKFIGYKKHHGVSKLYMSKRSDCKNCPIRENCIGKSSYKMLTNSLNSPLFDEMHKRIRGEYGKEMMTIRKSTVEPVIGTLVEYLGMQKIRTIGIKLANKCMIMAGIAHNLRKLIKHQGDGLWWALLSLSEPLKAGEFYYS